MEVDLRPAAGIHVTRASRQINKIRSLLRYISENPELHCELQAIATFHLTNGVGSPSEKGRARMLAADLRREFGQPEVAGFMFKVGRSEDSSEEYVLALFDPRRIQPGAYEKFKEVRKQRKLAAQKRYYERKNEC